MGFNGAVYRRKCHYCGGPISGRKKTVYGHGTINYNHHPFCSRECYTEYFKNNPTKRSPKRIFKTQRSNGIFKSCSFKNMLCPVCGKIFKIPLNVINRTCCSKNCSNNYFVGSKACNWQGGISFQPYCEKFNDEFKERVREWYNRSCVVCGVSEKETMKKLHVHHVNYNKNTCCDSSAPMFVPLCHSCHAKTNFNRSEWEDFFINKINKEYGGKCYFSKEEWKSINTKNNI